MPIQVPPKPIRHIVAGVLVEPAPEQPREQMACDNAGCPRFIEATPGRKEWRKMGHRVLCEKCEVR